MRIREFRVTNFRSIADTGWCKLSSDNVTVFVGQNESGKTSILDALSTTFSGSDITTSDLRINEELPRVQLKIEITPQDFDNGIRSELTTYAGDHLDAVRTHIFANAGALTIEFSWEPSDTGKFEGG